MAGQLAGERPKLIPLGEPHLLAEEARRHAVRFVADHQIPFRRCPELRFQLVVPRQHVEPCDEPRPVGEGVAADGVLNLLAAQDVEREIEALGEFVLPLLDETPWGDDEAALEAPPDEQLLDEQPRHDCLARARIVGEQEAKRLALEHHAVHGGELMR